MPKMARPDFPNGKFRFLTRWLLWSGGEGGPGGGLPPLLLRCTAMQILPSPPLAALGTCLGARGSEEGILRRLKKNGYSWAGKRWEQCVERTKAVGRAQECGGWGGGGPGGGGVGPPPPPPAVPSCHKEPCQGGGGGAGGDPSGYPYPYRVGPLGEEVAHGSGPRGTIIAWRALWGGGGGGGGLAGPQSPGRQPTGA